MLQPEVERISFSLPNKHHLLYDLGRFGLENENEIFHATNEPLRADRGDGRALAGAAATG